MIPREINIVITLPRHSCFQLCMNDTLGTTGVQHWDEWLDDWDARRGNRSLCAHPNPSSNP